MDLGKGEGAKLQIIRSGDLIGDGAQEYVAIQRMKRQPKQGLYVSRLVVLRSGRGGCTVVLEAGKTGPRNRVGYVGIDYIDDRDVFYGYDFEFGSDHREPGPESRYKCVLFLTWLNAQYEPEGEGLIIGWNEKVKRFQEIDESWEFFKTELQHPPHRNTKDCGKCNKLPSQK